MTDIEKASLKKALPALKSIQSGIPNMIVAGDRIEKAVSHSPDPKEAVLAVCHSPEFAHLVVSTFEAVPRLLSIIDRLVNEEDS